MRFKWRQVPQILLIFSFLALLSWHLQTVTWLQDKPTSQRPQAPRASSRDKLVGFNDDDDVNVTSQQLYKQFSGVPFVPGHPKIVVIMTYQRSGSSFFGEIFDRNDDVFYVYEPLDAVYNAMYGTKEGWNVPSDITAFWNGSERIPPEADVEEVASFLENLLSCRVDDLPTEFYRHRYWSMMSRSFQSGLLEYIQCIRYLRFRVLRCSDLLPNKTCPFRFGENWDQMDYCRYNLKNPQKDSIFDKYKACNARQRDILSRCIPVLSNNCKDASLKATKTVRANMASMERILARNPNSRVIHLMRDPRAVVLSRMKFFSTRGKSSGDNYVSESKIFCRAAVRDIHKRKQLEEKYPGRLIQVIYDDFVKEPQEYTEAIYKFLDAELAQSTRDWLKTNTEEKKKSTKIAARWQYKIPYKPALDIKHNCQEYFEYIPYPWP